MKKHHDPLKERIKECTAELAAANEQLQQEIAKRERVENELVRQKALWESTIESFKHPFFVINAADHTIEMANSAAARLGAISETTTCYALTHRRDRPCDGVDHPCPLEQVKRTRQPVTVEHVHFDAAGNARQMEIHGSPILDSAGNVTRMLEYTLDITERKLAEERVRQQQRALAAMEERERIGRELHDDLGQAMGRVNLQAQATLALFAQGQTEEANATLAQVVQISLDAHANAREYILGIKTTAKPAPDFFAALEKYLREFSQSYGIETKVSLPETLADSPFAPVVEVQLLRIIQETLTNVRKHAGVDAARLLFILEEDQAQIIIEDDGCGFDALSDLARVGDRLGLLLMRERAEEAGGSLQVRSAPGQGTRVIARMPLARALSLAPGTGEAEGRSLQVLLVDDHPLVLQGLRNLLTMRGVQVVGMAGDGLEAQELARSLRPDVIVMDIQMPLCDGIEATRRIKAELPEVKIVMLTVSTDEALLFEALKSGASGYLLKDMTGTMLIDLLADLARGEIALAPGLAAKVLAEFAGQGQEKGIEKETAPAAEADLSKLTPRQVETLKLVAQGLSYKQAATALHLSERTVKYHMGQILMRLHLQNRREAVAFARRKGLDAIS